MLMLIRTARATSSSSGSIPSFVASRGSTSSSCVVTWMRSPAAASGSGNRRRTRRGRVGERAHALRLEALSDPEEEAVALVEPEVGSKLSERSISGILSLPRLVRNWRLVERDVIRAIPPPSSRRQQRRGDRPGPTRPAMSMRCGTRAPPASPARLPSDPLDTAAFEDEIGVSFAGVHAASPR